MATKNASTPPVAERIAASFQQLSSAAARLNEASDELAQTIAPIDAALKKLNLGVTTWHRFLGNPDESGYYTFWHIGYAKVGGKWGLALAEEDGHVSGGTDSWLNWLFNEAPRTMRIEALQHIPALLDAMIKEAEKMTVELQTKMPQARTVADTIVSAATTTRATR